MVAAHVRMAVAGGETEEPMRNRGTKGRGMDERERSSSEETGGWRRASGGPRRREERPAFFLVGGVEKEVERYLFPSQ